MGGILYAGSKSGSSGSSHSSHRHSDILRHLGSGSETTEIRQLTSSDVSIIDNNLDKTYMFLTCDQDNCFLMSGDIMIMITNDQ